MPNVAKTFKQADLERAIRAARACSLPIFRSEVTKGGRIILVHFDTSAVTTQAANDESAQNEWDNYFDAKGQE